MRRILPPWAWLLVIPILIVGAMMLMRLNPPVNEGPSDPLLEAANHLESALGLQIDTVPLPGGGVRVSGIVPGTPAEQLGIQAGDRIVACGSQSVWHVYQLADLMTQSLGAGYPASLLVEREGTFWQVVLGGTRHTHAQPPAAAAP
ncbi:MAG: PDZ domain-containing protein [Armatimonadetes bacterium]|nr:PDZ domain-containing protein [Armatimonadota bacterium]